MILGKYAWWLPVDVSRHGGDIDQLIIIMHWFMGVLFLGWSAFFLYCLYRFRRRPGQAADPAMVKAAPSKYAEIGVAIFEIVLLLGFATPVLGRVRNQFPEESRSLVMRVVAQQFAWNFHYSGKDGVFGRTDPKLIDPGNPIGLDLNDPHAADDVVTVNEIHVPVDKPVILRLSSMDVIHSFAVPVMRVKQDVIPGMMIPIWFEAARTGVYDVACAQLCGNNHFKMQGRIHIETAEEFQSWLESQAPGELTPPSEEDFEA